ncbi:glutathione S-transferase [Fulvimarina endophytica]|uniref:Glutathione S-transferase n=1 Tax=Fulvimarina endophytica TaxID=2293836 RepID=A0A371X4W9_9HYPH|nr:glutathione S-transferase [Fulvimarina endophytica]RFC64260.1 glutathione S-transferase [Fulvimarina endophytica]
MITVHNLEYSRAMRVVWLLEEIGTPYDLKSYKRTDAYRAPPELKAVHPLGKSPVIEDGALTLSESAAILRYLDDRYGGNAHQPPAHSEDAARHDEWLDFVEGTMSRSVVAHFWGRKSGAPVDEKMRTEFATIMAYLANSLEGRAFLMGETPMLADIQISYLLAMANYAGALADHPSVSAYFERLMAVPAARRAVERCGPVMPPA